MPCPEHIPGYATSIYLISAQNSYFLISQSYPQPLISFHRLLNSRNDISLLDTACRVPTHTRLVYMHILISTQHSQFLFPLIPNFLLTTAYCQWPIDSFCTWKEQGKSSSLTRFACHFYFSFMCIYDMVYHCQTNTGSTNCTDGIILTAIKIIKYMFYI